MTKVLMVISPGFEELEAVAPLDILRRAEFEVTLASAGEGLEVEGRNGIRLLADAALEAVLAQDFDAIVLPGGPHAHKLRSHEGLRARLQAHAEAGRLTAAICAAPLVLLDAGLLAGRRYTAHFSTHEELSAALTEAVVVKDGNVLTSQGAGTAVEFGLALVEALAGTELRREIAEAICFSTQK